MPASTERCFLFAVLRVRPCHVTWTRMWVGDLLDTLALQMSHNCRNTCFTLLFFFFLLVHNKIPPWSTVLSRPPFLLLCGRLKSLVSKFWATTRSHWDLLQQEGASESRKASSAQNYAQMLARGPNLHEAACGQVGGVRGMSGYPAQRDWSVRPICFQHEAPWPHLCNSHHSSHHELLLLVSTASCEAGMGLRQRPMKPKGAFPLTQWALDQVQHLFGPLCTQHSQFILYPFLGLFLQ